MQPSADQSDDYEVIALASSAGGVNGLLTLLSGLDADLPVPVLAVQHLDPRHRTVIAEVLGRRTKLPVKLAEDEEHVRPGHVYLAPPDRHLLLRPGGPGGAGRLGRTITCLVQCSPFDGHNGGVVLLMEEERTTGSAPGAGA